MGHITATTAAKRWRFSGVPIEKTAVSALATALEEGYGNAVEAAPVKKIEAALTRACSACAPLSGQCAEDGNDHTMNRAGFPGGLNI